MELFEAHNEWAGATRDYIPIIKKRRKLGAAAVFGV